MHVNVFPILSNLLAERLSADAQRFLVAASSEIRGGIPLPRRAQLFSLASRHARGNVALQLSSDECGLLSAAVRGCNPAAWNLLETLRIALLLASPDLDSEVFPEVFEHLFQFADHGETCALYRSLPLLPHGERFIWRACEGCRSNMRSVFEAAACDSPYPAQHFDDVSWQQLVIKAVFIGAPLSRVDGLDRRLSPELARMALDLADERRSAGRDVPPQLWLCLGPYAGERGLQALEKELHEADEQAQRAALLALARAGALTSERQSPRGTLDKHAPFIERARKEGFTQYALDYL